MKEKKSNFGRTFGKSLRLLPALSETTEHSLNWSKTLQVRGPVLYFFQKQLQSIFICAQSRPNGRKKRFLGSYFFQSTDIKNRKNRSCVKCIRLPHCKILGHQVEYCKSLRLFDVNVKMGFLRWLWVKLGYECHMVRFERLQSVCCQNIKSLGSTVFVWQARTFRPWKSVGSWLTPLNYPFRPP